MLKSPTIFLLALLAAPLAIAPALAQPADVQLPRRQLADADRQAWSSAVAEKPRETANVPTIAGNHEDSASGRIDMAEMLSTGVELLGTLSGLLGIFPGSYNSSGPAHSSEPARGYGGPSGAGYVYRGSSQASQSTVTGGSQ